MSKRNKHFRHCGNCGFAEQRRSPGFVAQLTHSCGLTGMEDVDPEYDGCTFGVKGKPEYQPSVNYPEVTLDGYGAVHGCRY